MESSLREQHWSQFAANPDMSTETTDHLDSADVQSVALGEPADRFPIDQVDLPGPVAEPRSACCVDITGARRNVRQAFWLGVAKVPVTVLEVNETKVAEAD